MCENIEPESEWQAGPHFEEWAREERSRQVTEAAAKNERLFKDRVGFVRQMLREEPILSVRMIRLEDLAENIASESFDATVEPDGQGEFFRGQLYRFILSELWVQDRAFRLEHPISSKPERSNSSRSRSKKRGANRGKRAPVLAFHTVWLRGPKDPGLLAFNEALRQAKMIDAEGRWIVNLLFLGALLRRLGENQLISAIPQSRYSIKDEILVLQTNGSFKHPTEPQLTNAFKKSGHDGVPKEIDTIVQSAVLN